MKLHSRRERMFASISVVAIASFYSSAAIAQDQAAAQQNSASTPADGPSDAGNPADIVVTAQFRSQRLQDTPLAISAVTGALAAAKSQFSVNDIAKSSPSVNIEQSGNGGGTASSIFIRGIGQSDTIPAVDPGVGVYIDDVYYGVLTGSNFDLLDIDRVEILRGPQGTLAGKNSEGGSIKIYSKTPTDELDGNLQVSYGSYNRSEIRGAMNIPIVDDKVLLRVTGLYRHVGGYFKRLDFGCVNPGTLPTTSASSTTDNCVIGHEGGQDLAAVRAALRVKLSDKVRTTITLDRIDDEQDTTPAKLIAQSPLWTGGLNFITPRHSYTSYSTFIGHPFTPQQFQASTKNTNKQWGISNVFDADITDSLSLKSITAFRKMTTLGSQDGDASPYDVFIQQYKTPDKQFTQELRLNGSINSFLDWTVGAFYYHASIKTIDRIDVNGGFVPGGGGIGFDFITDDPIKAESKSGFAHAVAHLAENLNLTGGIRYTAESKDYTFVRLAPDGGMANPAIAPLNGVSSRFSGNRWDYRAAIDYRFSPGLLVYAQVATGFKGGGVNPRPNFLTQAVPFQPETVRTFEGGFKSDFLDRKARLNVSAFATRFKDIQLIVTRCDDLSPFPGAPCTQTTNAGSANLYGIEWEGELRPLAGLSFDFAGNYIHFKYLSVNPATGIPLNSANPFLTKWKISAGMQYEFDALNGSIIPRVDYDYRSKFETESVKSATDFTGTVAGRGLFNARLTYRSGDKNWEVSAAVTNLADKFYYATKFDRSNAPFFAGLGIPGRPREWNLSLRRSF